MFQGVSLRYLRFMTSEFPILLVTQKAYEASSNETLGSKYKFWFDHEELGRCLYKQSRENLGEDWAEKVASELCELLGLPHAVYELASTWEGDGLRSADRPLQASRCSLTQLFTTRGDACSW